MRVIVLLVLAFLTIGSTAFSGWLIENVDIPGINPSLALNSAGYPCIAYPVDGTGVKYAEWDGSQWLIECAYSLTYPNIAYVSLALDVADTPHISLGVSSLFYVTRDDSLEWQSEELEYPGTVRHTSLALDGEGSPHIAFGIDWGYILAYAYRSGSVWDIEILESGNNTGWFVSLKLDADDNPHISYARRSPDLLMYASMDETDAWSFQVIDSLSDECMNTSLTLSGEGVPHISYNAGNEVRYSYWTGSGWHIETLDACDSGSFGWGTSIALDSADQPHIAYCLVDEDYLMYASWNGSDWQYELIDTLPSYILRRGDPDLVLDTLDRPHISYWAGYPDHDLRYAWNDGTGISQGYEEANYNLLCGSLHPNPTLGMTSLQFFLAADSHIIVTVYDVSGHAVQIPESGQFPAGTHDMSFSVASPGMYFARISSGNQIEIRRFVVID
ncbi:MAG: T9SS type A sorting domain-containing protein [Candidatus Aegiribacteria sp.]|nr:T9SS type A sorting domain-containing protein [Candidatus Aegiribacteria sp.]